MGIPVEKNKTYELQIDAMGSTGEGIGRLDGFTVFVDGALSGETVRILMLKVKKSYGYGKLLEILTPSPERCNCAALCQNRAAAASCKVCLIRRSLPIKSGRCRMIWNVSAD